MKLIIASNNAHKLVEMKAILGQYFEEILSLREAGIDHETIEDGETFQGKLLKFPAAVQLQMTAASAPMLLAAPREFIPQDFADIMATTKPTTGSFLKNSKMKKTKKPITPAQLFLFIRTERKFLPKAIFTVK